jgi:Tfp pilus assembly protein PilN
MIRFNYHQSAFERLFGDAPALRLTDRLRIPLAAIGAALLVVTATWWIQTQRVTALNDELAALQTRVQASHADESRAQRLMASVARLRALSAGIASARREAVAATNTIARIGNDLPPQTWLTGVGSTPAGAWTIDGRSTRVGEIGTMLRRVQSIDVGASARLVSIAATGRSGHILDFVIGWDRQP